MLLYTQCCICYNVHKPAFGCAVRLMTPGEVSRISSTSRYAYDGRQDRPPEVPEGSSVEFEVELISFEKQPDWERAPPDAKIQRAGERCMMRLHCTAAICMQSPHETATCRPRCQVACNHSEIRQQCQHGPAFEALLIFMHPQARLQSSQMLLFVGLDQNLEQVATVR